MQPIWLGDAGLYHLQTIKTINEYPIIPGLGNIHSRLAFNQSYFSLIALLNIHPQGDMAYKFINIYLLCVAGITIYKICRTLKLYGKELFYLLTVTFISILQHPVSPSPDLTIGIFQALIFILLIKIIQTSNQEVDVLGADIAFIFILGVSALSIKISTVVFVTASIIAISNKIKIIFIKHKDSKKVLLICGFILLIHQARGYLLSGYPFYPSPIAGLEDLDWSMSVSNLINERDWIYSWARLPGGIPSEVLGSWEWLSPWYEALPQKGWMPAIASIMLCVIIYLFKSDCVSTKLKISLARVYAVLIASIIFWFITAPDIRFLGAIPGLLLVLSLWIFYQIYDQKIQNFYVKNKLYFKALLYAFIAIMVILSLKKGTGLGIFSKIGITKLMFDLSQVGLNITLLAIVVFLIAQNLISKNIKVYKNKYLYIPVISICWLTIFILTASYINLSSISNGGVYRIPEVATITKITNSGLNIRIPENGDSCWSAAFPCASEFNDKLSVWRSSYDFLKDRIGFTVKQK